MATLTIAIGNSDDKLSQREWSRYWMNTSAVVARHVRHIYGEFLTGPSSTWQSACWVVEGELTDAFRADLAGLAGHFQQDSIAVSMGETEMVTP